MTTFQHRIEQQLREAGWDIQAQADRLVAQREDILSKWLLGSRRVLLQLKMRFDEAVRTVYFQEMAIERTVGMPPPVFSVSTYSQSGKGYSEKRTDIGFGGGTMHYGQARAWLEQACRDEGWSFNLAIGSPF